VYTGSPMMKRLRPLIAAALVTGIAAAGIGAAANGDVKGSLSCVQPLDAAGIDGMLAQVGSPLAGDGTTFVNGAAAWGLDPRALIAIAAHETILETYAPALAIHNPFGIGPGRAFATNAEAITYAAELLARHYVGEGRRTLGDIGGKWAPVGAGNDPANLNVNWTAGVGASYRRLGGNPDAPITLDNQRGTDCQASAPAAPAPAPPAPVATGTAAPGVVVWGGATPAVDHPRMDRGADPGTGLAATIDGFTFPLVPGHGPITYADDFAAPGEQACFGRSIRCATTLTTEPGAVVVAATGGTLTAASPREQAGGFAFWVVTAGGDRIGYSGLASYAPGIAQGAAVVAGQALGTAVRETRIAWERGGIRINAFPLLSATFASQG
jgi:hypothetical protein